MLACESAHWTGLTSAFLLRVRLIHDSYRPNLALLSLLSILACFELRGRLVINNIFTVSNLTVSLFLTHLIRNQLRVLSYLLLLLLQALLTLVSPILFCLFNRHLIFWILLLRRIFQHLLSPNLAAAERGDVDDRMDRALVLRLLVELAALNDLLLSLLVLRNLHEHLLLPDCFFSQATSLRLALGLPTSLGSEKGVLDLEGTLQTK